MLGDCDAAAHADLLIELLHDHAAAVADEAERSLTTLAVWALRGDLAASPGAARFVAATPGLGLMPSADVDSLCRALAHGAMTYDEHHRRAPITGAVAIADRVRLRSGDTGTLRAWLANPDHAGHTVLRSTLRWSKLPTARLRALELLHLPHLALACADRLARASTVLDHELTLADAHLLARPARAARLAGTRLTLPRPTKLRTAPKSADQSTLPAAPILRLLSENARRQVPAFVSAFSAPAASVGAAIAPLITDTSPLVRHAAARFLSTADLAPLAADGDGRIARTAATRIICSRLPSAAPAPLGLTTPQDAAERLALRRAIAADRHGVFLSLRSQLRSRSPAQALGCVRALSLALDFQAEILLLSEAPATTDPQQRTLATVAAMLPLLTTPQAVAAAERLSGHADARVRANAVESLARISRAAAATLPRVVIELKSDPHHRVRANALRAALTASPAGADHHAEAVSRMLLDSRVMHRLAGLWLTARVLPTAAWARGSLPEMRARVGELARFDEDARVRARAAACVDRLHDASRVLSISFKRTPLSGAAA